MPVPGGSDGGDGSYLCMAKTDSSDQQNGAFRWQRCRAVGHDTIGRSVSYVGNPPSADTNCRFNSSKKYETIHTIVR